MDASRASLSVFVLLAADGPFFLQIAKISKQIYSKRTLTAQTSTKRMESKDIIGYFNCNRAALFLLIFALTGCGGSDNSGAGGNQLAAGCGVVTNISQNGMLSGRLEDGDCTIAEVFPGSNDPTFVDEYRVVVNPGGALTITMRSTEIDSFLAILDTSNSCSGGCNSVITLDLNDDIGTGPNPVDASLTVTLTAGTYLIMAYSFLPETGSYTLETSI